MRLKTSTFFLLPILLLFAHSVGAQTPAPGRQADLDALRAIYNALGGTNSGINWPVNAANAISSFQSWPGVTVDPNSATGRVVGLNLSSLNLQGAIPAEIGSLSELRTLDLSNNRFTGTVPTAITALARITTINLSRNRLILLPNFRTTASLTTINVANNQLAFDSFEANVGLRGATLVPQDSIGTDTTIVLTERDDLLFPVQVGGTANLYQWFKNGVAFGSIASTAELRLTDVRRLQDQGIYTLRITSSLVPDVTLWRRSVRVRITPCFVTGSRLTPLESRICEGQPLPTITGTPATSGARAGTVTYQWQRSPDGGRTWTDVGGNTRDYQPTALAGAALIRRLASDGRCVTDTSNRVSVTFVPLLQNNRVGTSYILCPSDSIRTLRGVGRVTGGIGRLRYVWQSSVNNGRVWRNEDATENFRPQRITSDTSLFRRVVSDSLCFADTSNVVRVLRSPRFPSNIIGNDQQICPRQPVLALRDTIRSDSLLRLRDTVNFRFRWQVSTDRIRWNRADSTNRADTFSTFLPLYDVTRTLHFRRLVVGPCTTDTSNVVTISLVGPINGNRIRSDRSVVCEGDTSLLNVRGTFSLVGGGGNLRYVWQSSLDRRSWNNRGDTINIAFRVRDISDTTYIRRIVIARCYSDTSNIVTINRAFSYGPNTVSSSQINCEGDSAALLRGSRSTVQRQFRFLWQSSPDSINWARIDTTGRSRDTASRRDYGESADYRPGLLRAPKTFFRRVVDNGCRPDTSNVIFIQIVPRLTNNRIDGTQTLCEGRPIAPVRGQVPQGGGGGYRYRWEVTSDTISGVDSLDRRRVRWALADTSANYSPDGLIRTTSVRRIVIGRQCRPDTSNVVKITIIGRVNNNNIRDNQEVCFGVRPDTLVGSVPTGGNGEYSYVWQRQVNQNTWQTVAATRDFYPDVNTTSRFRRIIFTECFTDTSNVVTIFVTQQIRNNRIIGGGQTICRGSRPDTIRAEIPIDGTGTFRYQWQTSRNRRIWTNIDRAVAENLLLATAPDSTTYYRRIVRNLCFSDTSLSVPLRILDLPQVSAGRDTVVNLGQAVRLVATGASRYVWTPREGLDNDSIASPLASPSLNTTYIVRGTDASGCTSTDTVVVNVATELSNVLRLSEVITPNGDGLNDVLYIDGIEAFPENTLIVFNRWGQELLQRRNYRNDWDGTIEGRNLPTGTYFIVLRVRESSRPFRGAFSVLN
jgi:large repetitive protein